MITGVVLCEIMCKHHFEWSCYETGKVGAKKKLWALHSTVPRHLRCLAQMVFQLSSVLTYYPQIHLEYCIPSVVKLSFSNVARTKFWLSWTVLLSISTFMSIIEDELVRVQFKPSVTSSKFAEWKGRGWLWAQDCVAIQKIYTRQAKSSSQYSVSFLTPCSDVSGLS